MNSVSSQIDTQCFTQDPHLVGNVKIPWSLLRKTRGWLSPFLWATILGSSLVAHSQTTDVVVATLNGRTITQQEVDDSVAAQIVPLQQQLYALRRVALDNLITRLILEDEARKRQKSVEELRRQLTDGPITVTREQIEATYKQNASFFAAMSQDEAKERLRLDLENQARMNHYRETLDRLRKSAALILHLSPPRMSGLDDGKSPTIGDSNALITIVEFSDFECPYCKQVQSTLKRVLREYQGRVRLVFKNLPLEGHRNAMTAARSAYCAGKQDHFWQFHDLLFSTRNLSVENLDRIANELGLDGRRFQSCLNSSETSDAVMRDLESAHQLGIESTPSFYINGVLIAGAISFEEFKRVIDRELNVQQASSSSSK